MINADIHTYCPCPQMFLINIYNANYQYTAKYLGHLSVWDLDHRIQHPQPIISMNEFCVTGCVNGKILFRVIFKYALFYPTKIQCRLY